MTSSMKGFVGAKTRTCFTKGTKKMLKKKERKIHWFFCCRPIVGDLVKECCDRRRWSSEWLRIYKEWVYRIVAFFFPILLFVNQFFFFFPHSAIMCRLTRIRWTRRSCKMLNAIHFWTPLGTKTNQRTIEINYYKFEFCFVLLIGTLQVRI